jgi:gamma-glutamylcyclotransferase (GGCT)/AIG2-like uncharacterized protein YtfP
MTLVFLSDGNAKRMKNDGYFTLGNKRLMCHYLGLAETVEESYSLKTPNQPNVFDWFPVPFREDVEAQKGTIKGYVFAFDSKHLPFLDLRYDNDYVRDRDLVNVKLKEQFDKDNKPFKVRVWMYFGSENYYVNIDLKSSGKHISWTNGHCKTYYQDVDSIC